MPGTLYIVGTPIGNLGDISARALEALRDADFIAAEDTRVTLKLLTHFGIKKPLVSYYEHNSRESGEKIAARVEAGENCALVTDAGMPAVSDPGGDLVRLCAERGIGVAVIPGPSALVAAVAVSGLPAGRFTFEGFLSTARRNRAEHLKSLAEEPRAMVFYEAPHKLARTLRDMLETFGDRRVSISRELTKLHEETVRTTLSEALALYEQTPPRGEFVLVIEGFDGRENDKNATREEAVALAKKYMYDGLSARDAVRKAAAESGCPKNSLYSAVTAED